MRKHVLVLTTSAAILCNGVIAAIAQAPDSHRPNGEQGSTNPPAGAGSTMQQCPPREGMMGGGMMGRGMMGPGMMGQGRMREGMRLGTMGPMMMRAMFALMDVEGDGKLSLQEFQAAHERIFKAMDANKDGFVTLQEMQDFIRGASTPASPQ